MPCVPTQKDLTYVAVFEVSKEMVELVQVKLYHSLLQLVSWNSSRVSIATKLIMITNVVYALCSLQMSMHAQVLKRMIVTRTPCVPASRALMFAAA